MKVQHFKMYDPVDSTVTYLKAVGDNLHDTEDDTETMVPITEKEYDEGIGTLMSSGTEYVVMTISEPKNERS